MISPLDVTVDSGSAVFVRLDRLLGHIDDDDCGIIDKTPEGFGPQDFNELIGRHLVTLTLPWLGLDPWCQSPR